MAIALTSPITGGAQTGFTSPTYTIVQDTAPTQNGKQYAVTALGGTQVGVDAHSVSKPFTVSFFRPTVLKTLPTANAVTGIVKNIPVNTYKVVARKGALPYASAAANVASATVTFNIPAGTDTQEPEDIRALVSALVGALNQLSAGIGDTLVSGVM